MVLPVKVFEIKEKVDAGLLLWKLKDFREEEVYKPESGKNVTLLTEILDLQSKGGLVTGIFSKDFMRERSFRRSR